ncbi:hypothetical protein J1N35_041633, partial [Gossypium stocksii]
VKMKQARLHKEILERFCTFFGYRINARKMNIYFSSRIDDAMRESISNLLGFQKVQNIRYYLGVPLLHEK